jgi:hypothetical protein
MLSLVEGLINLVIYALVLALTLGLASGVAVIGWRWSCAMFTSSRQLVVTLGGRAGDFVREHIEERCSNLIKLIDGKSRLFVLQQQIDSLELALTAAVDRAAGLELVVRDLESKLASAKPAGDPAGYSRVGLAPDCPDFLLKAARREFRKAFHPDLATAAEKQMRTRQFKDYEQMFDKLWNHRGCGTGA